MSVEKPNVESLFEAAVAIESAEERAAYVTEQCGDDHQLRRQLEQLLASDKQAGSFLEKPPTGLEPTLLSDSAAENRAAALDAGLASAFTEDEALVMGGAGHSVLKSLGRTIDVPHVLLQEPKDQKEAPVARPGSPEMPRSDSANRYQLQGEIARGGMGSVIKGRDNDLGRDLAIKVLLDSHKDKPEMIQRFVEEAQIGGQLQHPGIAPVYELGQFADRRPFFSMKLVKGETLSKLLAEREDPSDDRGRFVGVFEQICQTMAYAHSRGVIHRDLKPANIMVGAFGEVQVMDWGLAKVLSSGGVADEKNVHDKHKDVSVIKTRRSTDSEVGSVGSQTQMGSIMGTPAYMPPEQALGKIDDLDQRADVFGLGAILCEILTGQPPYVGEDGTQVYQMASRGQLEDCFTRLKDCGADAELIALARHCLEREPKDRPRDAGVLAERVTGYLASVESKLRQAELARAEEATRVVEQKKRLRVTLALAATVLLALTGGGGGWLWIKADRDARQANVTREVNEALNQATALREQAKTAGSDGKALFAQAREQTQRAAALVKNGPADEALVAQVQSLEAELAEEEKDRELIAALDKARLEQTRLAPGKNRFAAENALPKFREAFSAYGLSVGKGGPELTVKRIRNRPLAVREAIVAALDEWDDVVHSPDLKGLVNEPHGEWIRAVLDGIDTSNTWSKKIRATGRTEDPAKRRVALEALAKSVEVAEVPAPILTRMARGLSPLGEVDLLRRVQSHYPGDFWVNHNLGIALLQLPPPERNESIRFLTAAVALRPESPGCRINLSRALERTGHLDEAIVCCRKAIVLAPTYAAAHFNLGAMRYAKGELDKAIACYEKAIALDPKFAAPHINLGVVLADQGQVDRATACYRRAIELNPMDAVAHANLAGQLGLKGQWDEAIACCRTALKLDPKRAKTLANLSGYLVEKGQFDEAIIRSRQALEIDPNNAIAHGNLGFAWYRKGEAKKAIASCRKSIELNPMDARIHTNLGIALKAIGKLTEAIASCRKAVELDPTEARFYGNLGNALKADGQREAAIASYKEAIKINPNLAGFHFSLGVTLAEKGQPDKAIACFEKCIELDPNQARAHFLLGVEWQNKRQLDKAVACYRKSIAVDARDATVHSKLGGALAGDAQFDEAIAEYKEAIALDPKDAVTHTNLGAILCDVKREYDGAIACFQKAIELDPKQAKPHFNLGIALTRKGQWDEAIPRFQKAIELDPKQAGAHRSLGGALQRNKRLDEAIASWRRAIELDPQHAASHSSLGDLLAAKGQLDKAIACYRNVVELKPKLAAAHYNLGNALSSKVQFDEAVASYKKAIALDSNYPEAHCNLGHALQRQGRFAEALVALRRGHELGSKRPGWPYPSAVWLRRVQSLAALEANLPAVLMGKLKPKSAEESLALAIVCRAKKLYHAATRLSADAFSADAKLADSRRGPHRYNATCFAVLAAAGQGKDAAKLDDTEKIRLRKQALDWLRADLATFTKLLDSGPPAARQFVRKQMTHWQQDSDLASIRDSVPLAKLPADERKAFTQLWFDVAALIKKAKK